MSREIHSHSCVSIPACPWREGGREKEKGREERKGREEEKGEGREERKGGKGEEGRRKEGRDSCRNSCIISQMRYQTLGENAAEDGEKKETRQLAWILSPFRSDNIITLHATHIP